MKETLNGYTVVITRKDGTQRVSSHYPVSVFFVRKFKPAKEFKDRLGPHAATSRCSVRKATLTIEVFPRAKKKSKPAS